MMMRRGVPEWFARGKARENFHRWWPWVLSSTVATLYFFNREPFDDALDTIVSKIRRPMLKTLEWIEIHDVDPETMSLELPPDMLFGPLEFEKQMRFLLAALHADNELADGYLARVLIDHMDLSLDPPILKEEELIKCGGKELLEFAVNDFTENKTRRTRKHVFFAPDPFLQFVNFISSYPTLSNHFVNDLDGVNLTLRALRHCNDPVSRVLAMRALTLFAFTQPHDGVVEKQILQNDGVKCVLEAYRESTGDPTDTRYTTLLLSSMLRHYPRESHKEFLEAKGVEAVVRNMNYSRYKGIPQHLRVLHDLESEEIIEQRNSSNVKKWRGKDIKNVSSNSRNSSSRNSSSNSNNNIDIPLYAQMEEENFLAVGLGLLDAFPEYYEILGDVMTFIGKIVPSHASPLDLLEYRGMSILTKLWLRWFDTPEFHTDGTKAKLIELLNLMLDDHTCQRCYDPSVASYELQQVLQTARTAVESQREAKSEENDHRSTSSQFATAS